MDRGSALPKRNALHNPLSPMLSLETAFPDYSLLSQNYK